MNQYLTGLVFTLILGVLGFNLAGVLTLNARVQRLEKLQEEITRNRCEFYAKQKAKDGTVYILGPYHSVDITREFMNVDMQSGDVDQSTILEDCGCER